MRPPEIGAVNQGGVDDQFPAAIIIGQGEPHGPPSIGTGRDGPLAAVDHLIDQGAGLTSRPPSVSRIRLPPRPDTWL
jgi:hypothetical protein